MGLDGGESAMPRDCSIEEETEAMEANRETELSLTVPITNSLAFLFTVLGDWYVDRKVISRGISPFSGLDHCLLTLTLKIPGSA